MEYPSSHWKICFLNFVGNIFNIVAEHDGKAGFNSVEYTTAFLYSDWLYFLWHGIKQEMGGSGCIAIITSSEIISPNPFFINLSTNNKQCFVFRPIFSKKFPLLIYEIVNSHITFRFNVSVPLKFIRGTSNGANYMKCSSFVDFSF